MTRNAKIKVMVARAKAWHQANPGKLIAIRQRVMMARHAFVRTPLRFAVYEGGIQCNENGKAFILALDPTDEFGATVAMFLDVMEKVESEYRAQK